MSETSKPRLVGINHIAIEVGDIDQALDFYGKIFDFISRTTPTSGSENNFISYLFRTIQGKGS